MKTTPREVFHVTFSGLLLIVLTACGGGGGGVGSAIQSSQPPQNLESVPAPAEPFNIDPTMLAASSGGNSYAGTYTETPNKGTTMFDGQEANSSTISLTITENGTPIVTEIETAYYLENPYQPLGLTTPGLIALNCRHRCAGSKRISQRSSKRRKNSSKMRNRAASCTG